MDRRRIARTGAPRVPSHRTPVPGGEHPLLTLQRAIGNHAVGRLLARSTEAPATAPESKPMGDPVSADASPPAQKDFRYASLDEARKALRELIFIKGKARALLGELGSAGEFIGGIAEAHAGGEARFALIDVHPGKEDQVAADVLVYRKLAQIYASEQGLQDGELVEMIHSHPSGAIAFAQFGAATEQFSDADEEFVRDEGVPLGLLSPTGRMSILSPGDQDPSEVIAPVEQPGFGRQEYVPTRDDLRTLIRQEIWRIIKDEHGDVWVDGQRYGPEHLDDPDLPASVRRKLTRIIRRWERKSGRAVRRLAEMDLNG